SSDVDVLGTLLDASGAGLAQGRGGPHADVHIVSTLEAGRYYLRVAAGGGTEGRYQLRLDAEGIDR
ncbi:MAG: hypothetical protein HC897_13185, partial [Thermoanaerobaculia bacterium]|nr:hypothetical protein [Thermoanaerobaculia bacterium]